MTSTDAEPSRRAGAGRLAVRVLGAGALAAMGWIHWHLYRLGYSSVPTIGPLFLLNAVLGAVAALGLLTVPARWLALAELLGALLLLGTLGGLVLSLTVGLLGFSEGWDAPLVGPTLAVEGIGGLGLLAAAARSGTLRRWGRVR